MPHDDEMVTTFGALAALVHERPGISRVSQAIVDAAPRLIDGCDHASIMLTTSRGFETAASSDAVGAYADTVERELREGPCVDAIAGEAYQLDADIATSSQWPRLAARILDETPVRGMAGYRLMVDERKVGALNVFSDTPGALTRQSADAGAVLAAFASVALMGVAEHQRAETTAQGLDSNREIGKAIGMLMAAHGISSDAAFEVLRRTSSTMNLKIAHMARRLVDQQDGQTPGGSA